MAEPTTAINENINNFPTEMKEARHWGIYKAIHHEKTKTGHKFSKQPLDPTTGRVANAASEPEKWLTHAQAVEALKNNSDATGLVFFLGNNGTDQQNFLGIDLDNVAKDISEVNQGNADPKTNAVANVLKNINSYTETSISGNGIHVITLGHLPKDEMGNPTAGTAFKNVEMYEKSRVIAMTGNVFHNQNKLNTQQDQQQVTNVYNDLIRIPKELTEVTGLKRSKLGQSKYKPSDDESLYVKQNVNLMKVFADTGNYKSGSLFYSPMREDHNASVAVNRDKNGIWRFNDFSKGHGNGAGTILDYWAIMHNQNDPKNPLYIGQTELENDQMITRPFNKDDFPKVLKAVEEEYDVDMKPFYKFNGIKGPNTEVKHKQNGHFVANKQKGYFNSQHHNSFYATARVKNDVKLLPNRVSLAQQQEFKQRIANGYKITVENLKPSDNKQTFFNEIKGANEIGGQKKNDRDRNRMFFSIGSGKEMDQSDINFVHNFLHKTMKINDLAVDKLLKNGFVSAKHRNDTDTRTISFFHKLPFNEDDSNNSFSKDRYDNVDCTDLIFKKQGNKFIPTKFDEGKNVTTSFNYKFGSGKDNLVALTDPVQVLAYAQLHARELAGSNTTLIATGDNNERIKRYMEQNYTRNRFAVATGELVTPKKRFDKIVLAYNDDSRGRKAIDNVIAPIKDKKAYSADKSLRYELKIKTPELGKSFTRTLLDVHNSDDNLHKFNCRKNIEYNPDTYIQHQLNNELAKNYAQVDDYMIGAQGAANLYERITKNRDSADLSKTNYNLNFKETKVVKYRAAYKNSILAPDESGHYKSQFMNDFGKNIAPDELKRYVNNAVPVINRNAKKIYKHFEKVPTKGQQAYINQIARTLKKQSEILNPNEYNYLKSRLSNQARNDNNQPLINSFLEGSYMVETHQVPNKPVKQPVKQVQQSPNHVQQKIMQQHQAQQKQANQRYHHSSRRLQTKQVSPAKVKEIGR